jgi:tRNA(Arg) A34 adenosine deaminase TadA
MLVHRSILGKRSLDSGVTPLLGHYGAGDPNGFVYGHDAADRSARLGVVETGGGRLFCVACFFPRVGGGRARVMHFEHAAPDWLMELTSDERICVSEPERVRFVLHIAQRNVLQGTGGPFGAAVFERDSGRLVAAGVNRVAPLRLSCAHAETLALSLAQRRLGVYDLGAAGLPPHTLVSSAQPCLMCTGAVLWSGVAELTYAATKKDVERLLGFDEGFLPSGWQRRLRHRGISVHGAVLRDEARAVLRLYGERGGTIYNPRSGAAPPRPAGGRQVR